MKEDVNYLTSIICIIIAIVLILAGVIYRENNTEEKLRAVYNTSEKICTY